MEKALCINGADFSANALATVIIVEDEHSCTNIELSQNTIVFSDIGQSVTLTATLTPQDTTDVLSWESDNENIVVANGVVTANGVGTATITAKCGRVTAICEVTATKTQNTGNYTIQNGYIFYDFTSTKDMVRINANGMYSICYDGTNTLDGYKAFSDYDSSYAFIASAFPIPLPLGTSKIRVMKPENANGAICALFDSQVGASYWESNPTRQGAKCLDGYGGSVKSFTTLTPYADFDITDSNADSFTVGYRLDTSGDELATSDIVFM